ncbi:MAG: PD-(D/E)XK nuclease family protein, partial [Candidatus Acidiferrales bacterium]
LELVPTRLVFYNLTTNEPVSAGRDAKSLADTKKKIAAVADSIRAADFHANPGFGCRFCDFQPLCPAHEQLISVSPARTATSAAAAVTSDDASVQ